MTTFMSQDIVMKNNDNRNVLWKLKNVRFGISHTAPDHWRIALPGVCYHCHIL